MPPEAKRHGLEALRYGLLMLDVLLEWARQPGEAVTGQLKILVAEPKPKPEPSSAAPRTSRSVHALDPEVAQDLGALLREAREDRDWTLAYMAEKACVTAPTYKKFEAGQPHDSMTGLKLACKILGVRMPKATEGG